MERLAGDRAGNTSVRGVLSYHPLVTWVLGFNCTHDATASILRDGEVVLAVEEERLSRVKHHFGMPERAIAACLEAAGITAEQLDHVAFYMNTNAWLASYGWHFVKGLPRSASYLGRKPALWRSFLGIERRFRSLTGFRGRFHHVDHHAAHIDSAFWPSGFERAAALSVDGAGESATTVLARVDAASQQRFHTARYPISVGKVWEAVTDWLGYRPTQDEGKVMGLAPYGTDRFHDDFAAVLSARDDGTFHQGLEFTDFQRGARRLVSDRFIDAFGAARRPDEPFDDHHRDVAHALQHHTEQVVLALARRLREQSGCDDLVMAGGVALNCVANGVVARSGLFRRIYVQPAAGDNGAGLGAAWFVTHRKLGIPRTAPPGHAFLGPDFSDADVVAAAEERGLHAELEPDVVARAARRLREGAVLGWMQGRMEFGPRALGHRSILADPTRADAKDRVNARVKFREPFRPFAPSVTEDDADDWFEDVRPSPYMLLAFPVRAEKRSLVPAITHVDGTARVQTVAADTSPRYHALLRRFGELSGVPILLNTSFNVRGEPVVNTPAEALDALLRTGLDAVVVGDRWIEAPPHAGTERGRSASDS